MSDETYGDYTVHDLSGQSAYEVALELAERGFLVFVKPVREGDGAGEVGSIFIGWGLTPPQHVHVVLNERDRIRAAYLLGAGAQMWRTYKAAVGRE